MVILTKIQKKISEAWRIFNFYREEYEIRLCVSLVRMTLKEVCNKQRAWQS